LRREISIRLFKSWIEPLKKFQIPVQFNAIGFKGSRVLVAKWNLGKSILEPLPAGRQACTLESLTPSNFFERREH
jgi:hypothetical protein